MRARAARSYILDDVEGTCRSGTAREVHRILDVSRNHSLYHESTLKPDYTHTSSRAERGNVRSDIALAFALKQYFDANFPANFYPRASRSDTDIQKG
jgi:hypothetical protein